LRNFCVGDVVRAAGAAAVLFVAVTGCAKKDKPDGRYVFVTAKHDFLRDRVAAVTNRTGEVVNGDRLKVLDHARHFVKVQTDKGQVGWIEERAVATPEVAAAFDKLKEEHKDDADVASAVVRDQVYLHMTPGRDAERFYLLNEGEKLKLLKRATLVKAVAPGASIAKAQKAIPQAAGSNAAKKGAAVAPVVEAPVAPAMEDWWLVRDSGGHTGWMLSRMMDVDAPDSIVRYAEGQRIVGAYVLTTVHDDEAPGDVKDVPIYVTVMSPYKAGLPYDFDQVRVFTWSLAHHRYETGFRDRNIEGYLPIKTFKMKDQYGKTAIANETLPAFSYRVLTADAPAVVPDAKTGAMVPGKTITKTYRLEGNLLKRMGFPGSTAGEQVAHPVAEEKKEKKGKRR
jgi:hypothetical protein